MGRLRKVLLTVGVLAVIVVMIVLIATPGSVVAAKTASGDPANRTAVAALLGLLIMGFAAMGLDLRDFGR